jgi:hypothetical protein
MVLTNEFKQIKDDFLNNSQVEIDENRLLAISCLILNSSEVFEKTGRCEFLTEEFYVLVYSFTLDYLICNPDKGRIFTKCKSFSIVILTRSDVPTKATLEFNYSELSRPNHRAFLKRAIYLHPRKSSVRKDQINQP